MLIFQKKVGLGGPGWDTSNISYESHYEIGSYFDNPSGIGFKPDGSKLYVTDLNKNRIYQYDL